MRSIPLVHTALGALTVFSLLSGVAEADARAEQYQPYPNQPPTTERGVEAPPSQQAKGPPLGLQLGGRVGYGLGAGEVYQGLNVMDGSSGFIPLIFDIGARIVPELYVGGYAGWAHVFPRENAISCPAGFSCNITNYRFGVQVDWHFMPQLSWDPYVGVNAGYEILHNSASGTVTVPTQVGPATGYVDAGVTDRGLEFAGLTLGADMRVDRQVALGPFFTASVGEYGSHTGSTTVSVGNSLVSTGVPDVNHSAHWLFMLGLRATANPM
jgi:hypothetical protein